MTLENRDNILNHEMNYKLLILLAISGPLSPRHGASLDCRRTASNMKGRCEYTEKAIEDSGQWVVLQLGGWAKF